MGAAGKRVGAFNAFSVLLFLSVLLASASLIRAANLSTEAQLDVLAARIAWNENAAFNESNGSATAISFEKQGFGPYHSIWRYIAIYAPRNSPWTEIFEVNTERSIGDLDRSREFNGFFVYLALPEVACKGCYQGGSAPEKFKALFYCPKKRGEEYPRYLVYWEGNSYTPNYEAVLDALTLSCVEAQNEIARLEALAPSPSPRPSPLPSASALPSPSPKPSLKPSPSGVASVGAANGSTNGSINVSEAVSSTPRPQTALAAAGAVSDDEQWLTYSALLLIVGCAGIVAFFARKK